MPHEIYDAIIIGGGAAGLAAANELLDKKVLLLERDSRLGGRLHSYSEGDYWMNLGAHLFPGPDSYMGKLVTSLGLETIAIPGSKFAITFNGKVFTKNRVESYPLTLPMTLRERVSFAIIGLKMLKTVADWRSTQNPNSGSHSSERSKKTTNRLAKTRFRDLLGTPSPRVDAIFSTAARRASAELNEQSAGTGAALFGGVWAGKKSSLAYNLNGGSAKLAEALAKRLGERVRLNTAVTAVYESDSLVVVEAHHHGKRVSFRARQVIVATSADIAARIATGLPTEVLSCLSNVSYGAFVSMGVITSESGPQPIDPIYAITSPDCSFDMMFNHANPLRTEGSRADGGSLMVYSGGDLARTLLMSSDEAITELFVNDILKLYPQLTGKIAKTRVQRWPIGLPFNRPGFSLHSVRQYCESGTNSIDLCGDYFGDLGNMEFAARSGIEAARRALARIAAPTIQSMS
ncbi:hypothetical protein GCM10022381_34850 [Leifsonia kafniensis]|uniref:Amine oxidase domain-containing protein n=1 Tax=Leifsonia kafniensis TaxID=475957 RepID=A0ABP7KZP2_9MICO